MAVKDEAKNISIFAAIFAVMYAVGKQLDKGWWRLLGRGK